MRIAAPLSVVLGGGVAFAGLPGGLRGWPASDGGRIDQQLHVPSERDHYRESRAPHSIRLPMLGCRRQLPFPAVHPSGAPRLTSCSTTSISIWPVNTPAQQARSRRRTREITLVACSIGYPSAPTGAIYLAAVYTNGSRIAESDVHSGLAASITAETTTVVQLQAKDVVTCEAYQSSGGSIILSALEGITALSAVRLY